MKMEKFTKLGLSKDLTDVLRQMGFSEPSEIQEKTIPLALKGKDIIGCSSTGSGKTLAFSSAIIENLKPTKKIQAIILVPTRELAEQVANSIKEFSKNKKLNILAVYGGVRIQSQIKQIYSTDILVGTPGRILDHLNRKTLNLTNIKFLVLDEVDRMFDMGFSKDVEKIISNCPTERQTMMFSATISKDIDHLIKKHTKDKIQISIKSDVDPLKLKQIYYEISENKKLSLLVHLLKNEPAAFSLIFCNTRRSVDLITKNLINFNINANAIHGGLDQSKRLKILNGFKKKGIGVLVCTDVAARGIDIKEISHVYNYDFPLEIKDYIHRIGRTARAGKEGKAITLLTKRNYKQLNEIKKIKEINFKKEDLPSFNSLNMNMDFKKRNPKRESIKNKKNFKKEYSNKEQTKNKRDFKKRNNKKKTRGKSDIIRKDSRNKKSNKKRRF